MARKSMKNVLPRDLDEAVDNLKPEEVQEPGPLGLKVPVPKGLKDLIEG